MRKNNVTAALFVVIAVVLQFSTPVFGREIGFGMLTLKDGTPWQDSKHLISEKVQLEELEKDLKDIFDSSRLLKNWKKNSPQNTSEHRKRLRDKLVLEIDKARLTINKLANYELQLRREDGSTCSLVDFGEKLLPLRNDYFASDGTFFWDGTPVEQQKRNFFLNGNRKTLKGVDGGTSSGSP